MASWIKLQRSIRQRRKSDYKSPRERNKMTIKKYTKGMEIREGQFICFGASPGSSDFTLCGRPMIFVRQSGSRIYYKFSETGIEQHSNNPIIAFVCDEMHEGEKMQVIGVDRRAAINRAREDMYARFNKRIDKAIEDSAPEALPSTKPPAKKITPAMRRWCKNLYSPLHCTWMRGKSGLIYSRGSSSRSAPTFVFANAMVAAGLIKWINSSEDGKEIAVLTEAGLAVCTGYGKEGS